MSKILSKLKWYSFKEGVINLIRWLPIIWRDRDFDQNYLYRILHKKLEHMELFFRSDHAYTACANTTADEIKEAKDIVYKLLHDTYFTDLVEDIETDEIFSIEDGTFRTNEDHPDYLKKWTKADEQATEDREDDKVRLAEIIKTRIDNWWD